MNALLGLALLVTALLVYTMSETQKLSECTPDWDCTNWGSCVNNFQHRTCTDSNNCGTGTGKPATIQDCNIQQTCNDECSASGLKQCYGNGYGYRVCENYDSDPCLEWGSTTNCQSDQTCQNGNCITTCSNECSSGQRRCYGSGYQICGNYDSDSCLEWSSTASCPNSQTCSNGQCSSSCINECSSGAKECVTSTSYKTCGNYDSDSCLEWGSTHSCSSGAICQNGNCVSQGAVCGNGQCESGETCSNCVADCGVCQPQGSTKNLRFAGAMYASNSYSSSQVNWINSNMDLLIVHESALNSLGGLTSTKLLMYKTAAWAFCNLDAMESVCCYSELAPSHEDWFVHSSSGSRLIDGASHGCAHWTYYGSSGWRQHSISDIKSDLQSRNYVDGVFHDALQVEPGEIGGAREYSSESDMINKLDVLMDEHHSAINSVGKEYWGNIAPYSTGGSDYSGGAIALAKRLLDSADGVFDESMGINWGGGWYSSNMIDQQLQLMDYAGQTHKGVVMNALTRYTSDDASIVALYLLGKNDYTYFGFNEGGYNYNSYNSWINGNSALINKANGLGKPAGSRTKSGNVYRRNFENGYVTFDMSSHKGEIVSS